MTVELQQWIIDNQRWGEIRVDETIKKVPTTNENKQRTKANNKQQTTNNNAVSISSWLLGGGGLPREGCMQQTQPQSLQSTGGNSCFKEVNQYLPGLLKNQQFSMPLSFVELCSVHGALLSEWCVMGGWPKPDIDLYSERPLQNNTAVTAAKNNTADTADNDRTTPRPSIADMDKQTN